MRKILFLLFFFLVFCLGCIKKDTTTFSPTIVVSSFPIYSAIKELAGEDFNIVLLQKPFVNAHFYEPGAKDIEILKNASVFIYTSEYFDVWAKKALNLIKQKNNNISVIDASEFTTLSQEGNSLDPHFWLSPKKYALFSSKVADQLTSNYPQLKTQILKNKEKFLKKLAELDRDFTQLKNCKQKNFFLSHMAFGYLASDYNLTQKAIIRSFEPSSSEVSLKYFFTLIKEAKEQNLKVVYFEIGYPQKISKIFAQETNSTVLYLDTLEYYEPLDLEQKEIYITKMKKNLYNLKKGLDCE
ncbi:MAG: zinc ABC transporter substrate-binding protein [Candidatus Micrarchaeota archaeon]|nr:zinc ABC transporter substrate-binding protein [Candidatus Micrarchaeota archaeon]